MVESCEVIVVVTLLVLAACALSCTRYWNRTVLRKYLSEDVLFAPDLKVSLLAALSLPSTALSLPCHVDLCSQDKRSPPRVIVRVNGCLFLLVLCGDVEANPGPVSKFSSRRCEKGFGGTRKGSSVMAVR